MTDLLSYKPEILSDELVCLPKHRIERLGRVSLETCQVSDHICGHVGESLQRVFTLDGLLEQIHVLHGCRALLDDIRGVVEVDRDRHARQVFSDRVLDDRPDRDLDLWVLKVRKNVSCWRIELLLFFFFVIFFIFEFGLFLRRGRERTYFDWSLLSGGRFNLGV